MKPIKPLFLFIFLLVSIVFSSYFLMDIMNVTMYVCVYVFMKNERVGG